MFDDDEELRQDEVGDRKRASAPNEEQVGECKQADRLELMMPQCRRQTMYAFDRGDVDKLGLGPRAASTPNAHKSTAEEILEIEREAARKAEELVDAHERTNTQYQAAIKKAAELINQSRNEASEYVSTAKRVAELVDEARRAREAAEIDQSTFSHTQLPASLHVSRQVQFQTEQAATTSSSRPNVRTRSLSNEDAHRLRSPAAVRRLKQPQEVLVPTDFLLQLSSTGPRKVSDTVVAPKLFTGKAGQDAENWLEYLERYCAFRKLDVNRKRELFWILLQEGASDWLVTLPQADTMRYDELVAAFKANYFKSPELRWREAGEIWNQAQKPDERVDDFVTRIRRAARRLNFPPDVLHFAIINWLRAPIRLHVVQQGVKTLEDTLRAARIAEAAATSTSVLLSMMIEALTNSTKASEKQAAEIKQLAAKVATLTTGPVE
jgi:Retrotransposon gag protein